MTAIFMATVMMLSLSTVVFATESIGQGMDMGTNSQDRPTAGTEGSGGGGSMKGGVGSGWHRGFTIGQGNP